MNKKISIYQTLPRLFGNSNSNPKINGTISENGTGKFDDYSSRALQEIRDLGITHIWYTGIIRHATMTDYSQYGISHDHPALIKGRAGSPYAINDYYDVDPDLANNVNKRMEEFEGLINRTHHAGLGVIIDLVANHLFRQYHSIKKPDGIEDFGANDNPDKAFDPGNNFYYLPGLEFKLPEDIAWLQQIKNELPEQPYTEKPSKATGNDIFTPTPSADDWYETIKLNYGVDLNGDGSRHFSPIPDTWHKMLEIILFWAGKNIDGFRCDMAEMVPPEFWAWAIRAAKKKFPQLIFIAEIYNPTEYHNYVKYSGFDYLYDKVGLYDTLKNILIHGTSTINLSNCWKVLEGLDAHMLRFLENHDEVRLASEAFAGDAFAAIPAMTLSATMHRGPIMIYSGQEVGEPAAGESGFSGNDSKTTIYDYWIIPELQKWTNNGRFDGALLSPDQIKLRQFYQKILNFSIRHDAIVNGGFYDLMWANPYESLPQRDKIFIWLRHSPKQKLLFVANFDRNNAHRIKVRISDHAFNEMGWNRCSDFEAIELLWNRQKFGFSRSDAINPGLYTELKPNDVLIFEITSPGCNYGF